LKVSTSLPTGARQMGEFDWAISPDSASEPEVRKQAKETRRSDARRITTWLSFSVI